MKKTLLIATLFASLVWGGCSKDNANPVGEITSNAAAGDRAVCELQFKLASISPSSSTSEVEVSIYERIPGHVGGDMLLNIGCSCNSGIGGDYGCWRLGGSTLNNDWKYFYANSGTTIGVDFEDMSTNAYDCNSSVENGSITFYLKKGTTTYGPYTLNQYSGKEFAISGACGVTPL